NRRQLWQVDPTASYEMTQRWSIKLTGEYMDVKFEHSLPGVEVGYQDMHGAAGVQYALSQTSDVIGSAIGARYRPDVRQLSGGADAGGGEVRWNHRWAGGGEGYLLAGAQLTGFYRNSAGSGGGSETGYIGGAGAHWPRERSDSLVDITRSVGPSAS